MNRRLSFDSRGDRRFFGRKRPCGTHGVDVLIFLAGKDGAEQADLNQNGGKGIECGGVSAFGSLNGDSKPKRSFRDAVVKQHDSRDDLKQVAFDAFENALDVMDENNGVLERVQLITTNPGAEAETSENAGQAADIDGHAEVTPQKSTRVGAVGGQIANFRLRSLAVRYEFQSGAAGNMVHACTSARSRVQTCRKQAWPPRSKVSTFAHGVHSVRLAPERRSQMFPHRSQYLSSILRSCNTSVLAFIVPLHTARKNPSPWHKSDACWSVTPARTVVVPTTKLDSFAMTSSLCIYLKRLTVRCIRGKPTFPKTGSRISIRALMSTRTFPVTALENCAV